MSRWLTRTNAAPTTNNVTTQRNADTYRLNMISFEYEKLANNGEVMKNLDECEGRHVQQAVYSTFMGTLTQICFTCGKVRSTINWDGNRSWGGRRQLRKPGQDA